MSVILNQSVSTEEPKCSDERKSKWQEIRLIITPTIILITDHFSNSAKFRGTVKIPRQRANSAARLKILPPTENCGPYLWDILEYWWFIWLIAVIVLWVVLDLCHCLSDSCTMVHDCSNELCHYLSNHCISYDFSHELRCLCICDYSSVLCSRGRSFRSYYVHIFAPPLFFIGLYLLVGLYLTLCIYYIFPSLQCWWQILSYC